MSAPNPSIAPTVELKTLPLRGPTPSRVFERLLWEGRCLLMC